MQKTSIPSWAVERGRAMHSFPSIEPKKTALLVIDMQNYFIAPGENLANPATLETVPAINRIANTLRAAGGHVLWSRHTAVDEGPGRLPPWTPATGPTAESRAALAPGAPGHGIYSALDVAREDTVFDKYRYSAFYNAAIDLTGHLQARGIDTVIVTGTVTNCCCETTARDAMMRDFRVFFVHDATSAVTEEEHNAALLNVQIAFADVRSSGEILALITT